MFASGRQSNWNTASGGDLLLWFVLNFITAHDVCSIMAASWWTGHFSEPKGMVVLPVTLPEQPSSLALPRSADFASYQSLFSCTPIKKKVQGLTQSISPWTTFTRWAWCTPTSVVVEQSPAKLCRVQMKRSLAHERVITAAPREHSPPHLLPTPSFSLENTNKPTQFTFS